MIRIAVLPEQFSTLEFMNSWPRQLVSKRLTMNSFLLFFILGAVVAKNVQAASILEIKASVDKCAKEAGLTEEQLNTALKSYQKDADEKVKCFRGCLLKAHNVIADDGKIDENAAIKYYHGDKLEPLKVVIQKCTADAATGGSPCDVAQKLESCICSSLTVC